MSTTPTGAAWIRKRIATLQHALQTAPADQRPHIERTLAQLDLSLAAAEHGERVDGGER